MSLLGNVIGKKSDCPVQTVLLLWAQARSVSVALSTVNAPMQALQESKHKSYTVDFQVFPIRLCTLPMLRIDMPFTWTILSQLPYPGPMTFLHSSSLSTLLCMVFPDDLSNKFENNCYELTRV